MSSGHRHDHADGSGHDHRHGPGHSHAPTSFGRVFAISAILNIGLVLAQVVYGVIANSVALLADAGHNFGDVLGLLFASNPSNAVTTTNDRDRSIRHQTKPRSPE
jgi:cobalt-zinc-cadmium efflux system protein